MGRFCGTVGSRPAGRVRRGPRPAATTWKPLHGDTWRSRLREAGRSARDSDSQDQNLLDEPLADALLLRVGRLEAVLERVADLLHGELLLLRVELVEQ